MTDYYDEDDELMYDTSIAIIGMSGRFPKADDVQTFWQSIANGLEMLSFFTEEELREKGVDERYLQHPDYVKAQGTLYGVENFDAAFFGYNPREAQMMDPQHRLFLECAWSALEDAGYDPNRVTDPIGLYAGSGLNTYVIDNIIPNRHMVEEVGFYQTFLGNDKDFLCTRTSYKLNLRGPSMSINTACSTSLVAMHLACQSLLNGECLLSLAGGVSLQVNQSGYLYHEGGIMSPDGHCRAFDAKGQGIVSGSGVGLVVLKRLADARNDGDHIYGVIKGSAINNDGALKIGYTAPSIDGQAEVIAEALAISQVEPQSISYIETHGTATPLGDPIEIEALRQAYGVDPDWQCAIGSVKTNVGHLDTAAGVASVIKTLMAMQHQQLPPSLHFVEPNPKLDLDNSSFEVNTRLRPWLSENAPRRAGVSSFGIGGTNAHLILEEAPTREPSTPSRAWQTLVVSAKTEQALQTAVTNLRTHLQNNPDSNLADVAYTLQLGRQPFEHRAVIVARDVAEAIALLETPHPHHTYRHQQAPATRSNAFLFPGQGSQYAGMGAELYEQEPIFRETVDKCALILQPLLGFDLRPVLFGQDDDRLQETAVAQPALFTIEYALAQQWQAWGIQPQGMIGHSVGEYVAACLAGVFSLPDALRLIYKRGQLMQSAPTGSMLAVYLPESQLAPYMEQVELAAINGDNLCVLSGTDEAIHHVETRLQTEGIGCRRLHTSHAFHSQLMDSILADFTEAVRQTNRHTPTIPFISNVTGTWITDEQATNPSYWAQQIRQPVRFASGIRQLLADPSQILLEVGPSNTLSRLAEPALGTHQVTIASLPHPKQNLPANQTMALAVGQLWAVDCTIDWHTFYQDEMRYRVPLPTYPFQRERYWLEPRPLPTMQEEHSLTKQTDMTQWFYAPHWQQAERPLPTPLPAQTWFILLDELGLGLALAQRLKNDGHTVFTATVGERFTQSTPHQFTINPTQSADWQALRKTINTPIDQWVVAWTITEPNLAQLPATFNHHFESTLQLLQTLGRTEQTARVTFLTQSSLMVTGDEVIDASGTAVIGPALVIPQEYPHLQSQQIDLVWSPSHQERLVTQILSEFTQEPTALQVAYRGRNRWLLQYEAVQLKHERPLPIQPHGIYLITGGLGGLGLVMANALVSQQPVKLALMGRTQLPPRTEWEAWLTTHALSDRTSQKIRQIQQLESQGAEVLPLSADVSNPEQVNQAIQQIMAQWGALHGVIHTAGIAGDGVIQRKTWETAKAVLAPKVSGTHTLLNALPKEGLDFVWLFSSIASGVGGLGQVDYVSANAFLDATAHQFAEQLPILSINWDTWQQVGMAVETELPPDLAAMRQLELQNGITTKEGTAVFHHLLTHAHTFPQLVVATRHFPTLVQLSRKATAAKALQELEDLPITHQTKHPRPNLVNPYVQPQTETQKKLAVLWQDMLGIDAVGIDDNFFELGGHSLLGVQLVSQVKKQFDAPISAVALFETPTIHALAQLIDPEAAPADSLEDSLSRGRKRLEKQQQARKKKQRRLIS